MYSVIKGNVDKFVELIKKRIVYVLVIGNTRTAEIPGITVAGANLDLIKYTPPADAELLYHGKCLSIDFPPATPDGKPTPALVSYTALRLTGIPLFVVDSGLIVKPKIPFIALGAPVGENIAEKRAMELELALNVIERGKLVGEQLSKLADVLMIGESIPAGTTTAAAVLKALGHKPAVSSSMPENPIELKMKVVKKALERVKSRNPIEIISLVGDPVMAGVVGLVLGSRVPVILAGGTQMVAIANLISKLDEREVMIATTKYVAEDRNANLNLSPYPVVAVDPMLGKSKYDGLKAYEMGFVKEGVGAGGLTLVAYLRGIDPGRFLEEVEKDYKKIILNEKS